MDPVITGQLGREHPLARYLDDFLSDLANAGASRHTLRAYRGDLLQFAAHHVGEITELTVVPVRAYLAGIAELAGPRPRRIQQGAPARQHRLCHPRRRTQRQR